MLAVGAAACTSGGGGGKPTTGGMPPVVGQEPNVFCDQDTDSCSGSHTSLFAIAHDYNNYATTVLYRVTVPAWSTGTNWGDATNGFFYRATVTGHVNDVRTYVPFNGLGVDADNRPQLPQFTFVVPVDVTDGANETSLEISACASNYAGSGAEAAPCTQLLWTEVYTPLPLPVPATQTTFCTAPLTPLTCCTGAGTGTCGGAPLSGTNVQFLNNLYSLSIPNNGVYPGVLTVGPSTTLTDAQVTWLYNHLVVADTDGNVYTNDIFDGSNANHRSLGVLSIDEAAYSVRGATTFTTKYGNQSPLTRVSLPQKQLFYYTADELAPGEAFDANIGYLYDEPNCRGVLNLSGSLDPDCGATVEPPGEVNGTFASITPQTGLGNGITAQQLSSATAGSQESRSIVFSASGSSVCNRVVNPLGVNTSEAYSPPNFVISSSGWSTSFASALYYVQPSGFGNCDLTLAPFCHRTSGYVAYVPHYADSDGAFGSLNGGSTSQPQVGSFTVADQYAIGTIAESSENALVYFDNCGYGYTYNECSNCEFKLGTRLSLPSPPKNHTETLYTLHNGHAASVVLAKECCASWYQENATNPMILQPPQQLDDGFGTFIAPGQSVDYTTLFSDETAVVYDATTGTQLYKLRLNGATGAVYACNGQNAWSAAFTVSNAVNEVSLGGTGTGAVACGPVGECPFGMVLDSSEGEYNLCTATTTSFILGMPEWSAALGDLTVQVRAWGAQGGENKNYEGSGAFGGDNGFALTVLPAKDLDRDLYAYVGLQGRGGSSTVLTGLELSALGVDPSTIIDPETVGVLLIAGGGAEGGETGCGGGGGGPVVGGNGAVAIANAATLGGVPSSTTGQQATCGGEEPYDFGGKGGNPSPYQGQGGDTDASNGIGGYGGGTTRWNDSGSLIQPQQTPTPWMGGNGANVNNAAGGGGFGGGGGQGGNGGGGGGSWAFGNTAYDANAPSAGAQPSSPGGVNGAVQLAYIARTPTPTATPAYYTVTYSSSTSPSSVDLAQLATDAGADDSTVIWIQAWGGAGGAGEGLPGESAGSGGGGGFAQTVTTINDLRTKFGTTTIHLYLGSQGDENHPGGKGGSSTIVAAVDLNQTAPAIGGAGNIVLLAGGGGGGSEAVETANGVCGGAGGSAIAGVSSDVSVNGSNGCHSSGSSPAGLGGGSGNGGAGGSGDSPSSPYKNGGSGGYGIGGLGGPVHTSNGPSSLVGWLNATPAKVSGGSGGEGEWSDSGFAGGEGGGGGGGYGGGGGGSCGADFYTGGGGGGGGSFAIASTNVDASAPSVAPSSPGTTGAVRIVFDLFGGTHDDSAYPGKISSSSHPTPTDCLPSMSAAGTVLSNGDAHLEYQGSDGNLVLYVDTTPVWSSGTAGVVGQLCFQGDGNLVIYNATLTAVWASGTADAEHNGNGGRVLTLRANCNLVIEDGSGNVLWQTNTQSRCS